MKERGATQLFREPEAFGRGPGRLDAQEARRSRLWPVEGSNVIVDFVFEDGLLFVSLENIGDTPAADVSVEFEPPVHAAEGRDLGSMALFRRFAFLAPRKRVVAFVDSTAAYFARGEPSAVAVSIRWRDQDGEARSARIRHDLDVYRDLPHVPGRPAR